VPEMRGCQGLADDRWALVLLKMWAQGVGYGGYPNRPNVGAYIGTIVHSAAELIIKSMVAAQVSSAIDSKAMATLRSLGGYSQILSGIIDNLVAGERGNPRFAQVGPSIERTQKSKIPQMREMIQQLLATRNWWSGLATWKRHAQGTFSTGPQENRYPLGVGTHFEVTLRDKQMMWTGRLDVVEVSEDSCNISDIKTASPTSEHHEQMRVYAMLWNGDSELNPKGSPVTNLELVYGGGLVQIPIPVAGELDAFRDEISSRTNAMRNAISLPEVPAKPSRENCRYCQVKLLCEQFWGDLEAFGNNADALSNVVVVAEEARSESTWFVKISSSDAPLDCGRAILKRFEDDNAFWAEIKPGLTVRLADVLVSLREPEDLPLISLTMLSEALFI
jgi:hypothetical protein